MTSFKDLLNKLPKNRQIKIENRYEKLKKDVENEYDKFKKEIEK